MRPVLLAVIGALIGLTYYRVGTPSIKAYPSADGALVLKLTLSRAPGFVAYLRTSDARALGPGKALRS